MITESFLHSSSPTVRQVALKYLWVDVFLTGGYLLGSAGTCIFAFAAGTVRMGFMQGLVACFVYTFCCGLLWFLINILSFLGIPRVFLKLVGVALVVGMFISVMPMTDGVDKIHKADPSWGESVDDRMKANEAYMKRKGMNMPTPSYKFGS